MKICYLADGESVHTERWCRFFRELGHEIHLITFKNVQLEGIKVHYINAGKIEKAGGNWRIILKYQKVKRLVKKIEPDILHAHYATSYGLVGALSGFHPYIITAMGTDILISPFQSLFYKILVRYILRKADWITSMADHMTDKLIILGVPKEKVSKIIFGIDDMVFNSLNHKVPDDRFVITSTRYFEPVYNLPLLFNAIKIVKNKIPGLILKVVGDGALRAKFETLVDELEIRDVVDFTGRLSLEKLVQTLNQTHIYVTVAFSDGNSVSLLEAMACGAFIIASDIPANSQWIVEGVNGFKVSVDNSYVLADKILFIYENFSKLEFPCMEYNNKIISEKALWDKNMEQVQEKYESLKKASDKIKAKI